MNGFGGFPIFKSNFLMNLTILEFFRQKSIWKSLCVYEVCRYFPHANLIEILFSIRDISKSRHFRRSAIAIFAEAFLLVSLKKRNES